jgi:predicted kinase
MVMGLPGVGKSYFARALAESIDAVHINSDLIRKQLLEDPLYTNKEKSKVYDQMFDLVCRTLEMNKSVVVDATFSREEHRLRYFRYIQKKHGILKIIQIIADEDIVKQRLKVKRPDSDADYEVYKKIRAEYDELPEPSLSISSTELELEQMIGKALEYIG